MNGKWKKISEDLDFAFQPVVCVTTGRLIGVEALLRNYSGYYPTIYDLFDGAYAEKVLYSLEMCLREKALSRFSLIKLGSDIKLFFNVDNRVMQMADYEPGRTLEVLQRFNICPSSVCFEISEKHEIINPGIQTILQNYRAQGYNIAVDDFGAGYSGVNQMYYAEPDYIKIDRFLVKGINHDLRKKQIVSSVVNLSHTLGMQIIAEGIETYEELCTCREIGCDFVQGFFIHVPVMDPSEMIDNYELAVSWKKDKRQYEGTDRSLILQQIQRVGTVSIETDSVEDVLEYFRKNSTINFLPLVNRYNEPVGILKESTLKKYVYSPYGRELLRNRHFSEQLRDLAVPCVSCDIGINIEKVIEIFSLSPNSFGIIITELGKYRGFLSAQALISIINEKNLAFARSQNPLSKLPGNLAINREMASLKEGGAVCYFDFDNFKPFNDRYGFRTGDRAILMFADILNRYAAAHCAFAGHIGGDDFIVIKRKVDDIGEFRKQIFEQIVIKFRASAETLYAEEDRRQGYIISQTRSGDTERFELLSVSCVIVYINGETGNLDNMSQKIAHCKKEAKNSSEKIIVTSF